MKSFRITWWVGLIVVLMTVSSTAEDIPAAATPETVPSTSEGELDEILDLDDTNDGYQLDSDRNEEISETNNDEEVGVQQSGPLFDLLGPHLLSLEMIDETHAQLQPHLTTEALQGKKVIGLYFSADWCGPCRQFTPELNKFYEKMNSGRKFKDKFEIVWVSRCRDVNSYGQYFAHMANWMALPPEEAMGQRGQMLSDKYKVKGIPTLVLLDEFGGVITTDGRNLIPKDKAGIGFPWRNPVVSLYLTLVPRTLRLMVKSQVSTFKDNIIGKLQATLGLKRAPARQA